MPRLLPWQLLQLLPWQLLQPPPPLLL